MISSTAPDTFSPEVDTALEEVYASRPALRRIAAEPTLEGYLAPVYAWNPDRRLFPGSGPLKEMILTEATRLYGHEAAAALSAQLDQHWMAETGAHLGLPRVKDSAEKEGPQLNPLVLQGQVLSAAMAAQTGQQYHLSLSTGRIPLKNAQSGSELQLTPADAVRTAPMKKFKHTPQTLIPGLSGEPMKTLRNQVGGKGLKHHRREVAMRVLELFDARQAEGFASQVAVAHSYIMDRLVLPQDVVRQLTIDDQGFTSRYVAGRLDDETSVLGRIFRDEGLRTQFLAKLADVPTAWSSADAESPFEEVVPGRGDEGKTLRNYDGPLDVAEVSRRLKDGTLMERGAVSFFAYMTEAGFLPLGGMNQAVYAQQLRDVGVDLLEQMGEHDRADVLRAMPLDRAVITPCWGVKQADGSLIDIGTFLEQDRPLTADELAAIPQLSGRTGIVAGLDALHSFLVKDSKGIGADTRRSVSAVLAAVPGIQVR